ncbi:MAG: hypothetical protein V3R86_00800 [Candidatus Hydrothermarchaeaceae archaeon]
MGRRRRYTKKRGGHKNAGGGGSSPRVRKLDMRKLSTFEYQLKKILEDVDSGSAIFGNVYSKSANMNIANAKEYVEILADDDSIQKDKASEIIELLNRFSTMR